MAAPKGHPRWGGRRKGSVSKPVAEKKLVLACIHAGAMAGIPAENIAKLSPLEAMLLCLEWAVRDGDRKAILAAAAVAAPYVHPKLTSSEVKVKHDYVAMDDATLLKEATEIEAKLRAKTTLPSVH